MTVKRVGSNILYIQFIEMFRFKDRKLILILDPTSVKNQGYSKQLM